MLIRLAEDTYWVGVTDWALRQFHGHELSTHRGTSYNAYLIMDEKVVLVDTVRSAFQAQLLDNIREIIDPAKIDIVVANHAEADHSGSLPAVLRHCPNATLVVSRKGRESFDGHYHQDWKYQTVKTGDRIDIGSQELEFIEAPMLHWPDTMFTYLTGKKILMSNDAFGQHYASSSHFNDEVDQQELYQEALKYYANILTPYSSMVQRKINEILTLDLKIDIIAPSHGIIWRQNPIQIVNKYQEWASQQPEKRAVIIYDTIWEATRLMAEAIGEGFASKGVEYKIFHTAVSDRNDIVAEILLAKAVILGCPTFNQGILPSMTPILEDLRGLKFQNKIGAAFGSYGWSGEGLSILEEHLARCKFTLAAPGFKAQWQPTEDDLVKCREMGEIVGQCVQQEVP